MQRDFTDAEKDRLAEVMKTGASDAAAALSRMLGKQVKMSVPKVFSGPPEKAALFLGQTENLVSAVLMKVSGDLPGLMMMLFPPKSAASLAALLLKRKSSGEALDEMDRSALSEVGNIAVGAALTSFSTYMDLHLFQSVPDVATDMLGSVVDGVFAELGRSADRVLVSRIELAVEEEGIEGMILFLFDNSATETILDAAGKKLKRP